MCRALIVRAVAAVLLLGLEAPSVVTQGTSPQRGIVTTTVTIVQRGEWQRQIFTARDAISVRTIETCRYEIVDWSDEGVTLERQFCDATVTADGGGEMIYPPPVSKSEKWTYFAGPKPTSHLTDLTLDPKTGGGLLEFHSGAVRSRSASGEEGDGAGPAAIALGLLNAAAAGAKLPEGAQFSGGPSIYEVQRFKFPPTAKQFSGGNQGAWTLSWTEGDGGTGKASASVSYAVSWGQPEKRGEMVFLPEPEYDVWLPAPTPDRVPGIRFEPEGRPLRVRVFIKPAAPGQSPKKDVIHFSLEDVSRHKGYCVNFPKDAMEKDDLRFAAKQPAGIIVDGPRDAHTAEEVSEAEVLVEALDTAASGKLSARASVLGLRAKYEPANTYALIIPRDQEDNGIADSWEGMRGLDPDADDEAVRGYDAKGDGITVEDEYRGVVLGTRHQRLSPKVKEMFLLDPGGDIPIEIWGRITRIQAYRVEAGGVDPDANQGQSPLVNFNASDSSRPFYALRIRRIDGDVDPDPAVDDEGNAQPKTTAPGAFPAMAYAYPAGHIKDVEYVKVFPARVGIFVGQEIQWLETALAQPASDAAALLRDPRMKFTPAEAAQALAVLRTPAGRAMVEKRLTNLLFLHELGHACGDLEDHKVLDAPNDEVRQCLMFYQGPFGVHRMVAVTALGRGDPDLSYPASAFCTTLGCTRKLTVKDW